jgi:predicted metal-dependent phosphoesterase TrpH
LLRADLHVHTKYSVDCDTPLEKIIERCHKVGVNCIAVADHGTVEGALRMREMAPFPVVVAQEILTPHGEIMGVFLKETISSGVSVRQAIDRIRAQDGLVCLPHPFDTLRRLRLEEPEIEALAAEVDIIEAFNARSRLPGPSIKAKAYAERHGLAQSAGSDAHSLPEIGRTYVEMPEFEDRDGYLQSLRQGRITGRRTSVLVHFASLWARVKKAL